MPQLHILIRPFITVFYYVSRQPHLKICHQQEEATLFLIVIEYLVSQTRALQVLVSKISKQSLNQQMPKICTVKILNYEGLNWFIQFL